MEFRNFKKRFQENFKNLAKGVDTLFEVNVDKDELWNLYLDSFPSGTNEIYRERREYDCSCCRHFIKSFGNVVVIKDNQVHTIWGFDTKSEVFQPVVDALDKFIKSHAVSDVYVSKLKKIGIDYNFEVAEGGKTNRYDHFYIELPDRFVTIGNKSEGEIKGRFRDVRNVFKRSLDEISEESILTILELISSNTLYKGEEWKAVLQQFLKYKKEYDKTPVEQKGNYAWEKSIKAGSVIGKIRNHSIGTLLVNVSEGMDLDTAVKKYEQIVAPSNYKRPIAIYTKKMLEDAKKTITELGYLDSLNRRFATPDDISANNLLFLNRDIAKRVSGGDIFSQMEKDVTINPKQFSRVEEIGIEKFVKDVLPTASEVEVYLENKHTQSMVSLITPENRDSKSMFKWENGFSWAYTGNMADSDIRENVKSAGGAVTGVLRFSIQWNEDGKDNSDLDAHCIEPSGFEIFFSSAKKPRMSPIGGQLDIDVINPNHDMPGRPSVENITWPDKSRMTPGVYKFFVNQYTNRGSKGFKAEVEFDGQIHSFEYNRPVAGNVYVAEVTLHEDGTFTIKEKLPSNVSSREVWGLQTNQFVPVSVICYSPNYWDEQNGIGHRHYMFMLKGCVNPEMPNGMFNEYLKEELMQHKRVFEALGSKCHVEDCEDQLSGLGFSSTKRAELIVKVKGQTERVMKVKF